MAKTPTDLDKVQATLQKTIDHIVSSGQMTRYQYLALTSALLADRPAQRDRQRINQILESVQFGKLRLLD